MELRWDGGVGGVGVVGILIHTVLRPQSLHTRLFKPASSYLLTITNVQRFSGSLTLRRGGKRGGWTESWGGRGEAREVGGGGYSGGVFWEGILGGYSGRVFCFTGLSLFVHGCLN